MIKEKSKRIKKTDVASKKFIISLLGRKETHGVDIDCLYYTPEGWIVIEFLKCDTFDPHLSHPNRYPFNWKKFATLFELSKKLEGKLYLVNYSDKDYWKDHVKQMCVVAVYYDKVKSKSLEELKKYIPYLKTKDKKMSLDDFKDGFKKLNNCATAPWSK